MFRGTLPATYSPSLQRSDEIEERTPVQNMALRWSAAGLQRSFYKHLAPLEPERLPARGSIFTCKIGLS